MPPSMPSMPLCEIIAIIPASGKGSRFGSPKAVALLEGKTFAETIIGTLKAAGLRSIHLASYADTDDMLATLRRARQELKDSGAAGYLIFPVDFPFVTADSVLRMMACFRKMPDKVVRPLHKGAPGHPVIIPAALDLDADDHGKGLRGIIQSSGIEVTDLAVGDPGILRNINTPNDMEDSFEHR